MAGVGAGDNSANVTTMATDLTALSAAIKLATGAGNAVNAVSVTVDKTLVPTVGLLRQYFNQILLRAQAAGMT